MNGDSSLTYLPLLIRLKCCEDAHLPAYLGSTLHGVVGWALSSHKEAYQYIYKNRRDGETKLDIPNPYIIEPPIYRPIYLKDDELCFKLILIGNAGNYINQVIDAFIQTQHFGLGVNRKKFKLVDIFQSERLKPIWHKNRLDMSAAVSELITTKILQQSTKCSILLLTPLRIRRSGNILLDLDFPTIIRNITRRFQTLSVRYGEGVHDEEFLLLCRMAEQVLTTSSSLYLSEMYRYSNRQNKKIDLSGLLGTLTFDGNITPFTGWLSAARTLHIGRNTTFGCGQFEIVFNNFKQKQISQNYKL